jgi:UDP-glucose 4-epimerase
LNGRILVTGGAGYIGSHTVLELLQAGFEVVVLDNLCNASAASLERVARLAGRRAELVVGDLRDEARLRALLADGRVDAAIHFAGLKAVGESVSAPLDYYDNNVAGTITLLRCLEAAGVRRIVFSSSATVYGDPQTVPIREDAPTGRRIRTAAPSGSTNSCCRTWRRPIPAGRSATCATSIRSVPIRAG